MIVSKQGGTAVSVPPSSLSIRYLSSSSLRPPHISSFPGDSYIGILIVFGMKEADTCPIALHFKLAVATDSSPTNSYEDTEFQYTPRLDSNRDRDLLDILPDYLTDEITFSRQHAAKFYSRVVDTLTRKIED